MTALDLLPIIFVIRETISQLINNNLKPYRYHLNKERKKNNVNITIKIKWLLWECQKKN